MAPRLRVFISSPGDVRDAREVVARTVEKVAQDYLRHFELEPYMWETEALLASGHFQDAIEPPRQFDIVTLILWSRLGTLLPEKTAVRAYAGLDGRTPVTGTEWEYEDALGAAREHGVPDLLVYRSRKSAAVDAWDADRRKDELDQLASLDRFWSRHFADRGTFIGAYHEFKDLEELAANFESHLRQLVDHRVAAAPPPKAEQSKPSRIWAQSPFRGLEAFDVEHAPIFFGRTEAVGKALSQLIDNASAGRTFLLVLGASGSGKSSLAKAGIVHRLSLPRRVVGLSFLRRVTFHPSQMAQGEDLFDAFAKAICARGGEGVGLPETGKANRLATIMREGAPHAYAFVEAVLDSLTGPARERGIILLHEEAALILVIDQLEELFTDQRISVEQRRQFVDLLDAFARGGRIWVVATMRADLWHRASEAPALIALAEGTGRFDLIAPKLAEVRQMITLPADAAGLGFESNPGDGIMLNDQIADDASQAPGVLPLLSYLLEQLYQTDAVKAHQTTLTHGSYQALGRLQGAIAARAEAILAAQTEEVRAELKQVLFSLVQLNVDFGAGTSVTARRAPLSTFSGRPAAMTLVAAFLDPGARLLVAEQADDGDPIVRVAHEALLTHWGRARSYIADQSYLLSVRRMVEERYARSRLIQRSATGPIRKMFTARPATLAGADLKDARRLLTDHLEDLPPEIRGFVERSIRREWMSRSGAVAIACSIAAIFAALVYVAAFESKSGQLQAMDRQVINDQRDGDDALRANDPNHAIAKYSSAVGTAAKLVSLDPANPQWRLNLASTESSLGFAFLKAGNAQRSHDEFVLANAAASDCANVDQKAPDVRADRILLQKQLQPYLTP